MDNICINTYVVRDDTGTIDHTKTLEKFAKDLIIFEARREEERNMLAKACADVFDRYRGVFLNSKALASFVGNQLKATPDTYADISKALEVYVRDNADGKGQDLFAIVKGRGIGRKSDRLP